MGLPFFPTHSCSDGARPIFLDLYLEYVDDNLGIAPEAETQRFIRQRLETMDKPPVNDPSHPTLTVTLTKRLRLRRFLPHEADLLYRLVGNPEVMRYSLVGPKDRAWCVERLAAILNSYETRGFGFWAVETGQGEVIGWCGLIVRDPESGEVELGYRYHPDHWGKGYGKEAARAALSYAFEQLRLPRVRALVEPANVASWKIAEAIGMTPRGMTEIEGKSVRIYEAEAPA